MVHGKQTMRCKGRVLTPRQDRIDDRYRPWQVTWCVLCLLMTCAVTNAGEAIPADALKAIDAGNNQWVPALAARNAEQACRVFAPDAIFIGEDGSVTAGSAAFAATLQQRFDAGLTVTGGKVTRMGAQLFDGQLVEWGNSLLLTRDKDGVAHKAGGNYLAVWSKGKDGAWRITRNIALAGG